MTTTTKPSKIRFSMEQDDFLLSLAREDKSQNDAADAFIARWPADIDVPAVGAVDHAAQTEKINAEYRGRVVGAYKKRRSKVIADRANAARVAPTTEAPAAAEAGAAATSAPSENATTAPAPAEFTTQSLEAAEIGPLSAHPAEAETTAAASELPSFVEIERCSRCGARIVGARVEDGVHGFAHPECFAMPLRQSLDIALRHMREQDEQHEISRAAMGAMGRGRAAIREELREELRAEARAELRADIGAVVKVADAMARTMAVLSEHVVSLAEAQRQTADAVATTSLQIGDALAQRDATIETQKAFIEFLQRQVGAR